MTPALAQLVPEIATSVSEDTFSLLAPRPHSAKNPLTKISREYRGLAVGDFLFYPSLLVSAALDDNLLSSRNDRVSVLGTRVNPRLVAVRDTGMHKTMIYGDLDARIYPSLSHGNAISGQMGFAHKWEVQRDLVVKTRFEFNRKATYVSGGVVESPMGTLSTIASPLNASQWLGSAAVIKSYGKMFVGLSGEVVKTNYDSLTTTTGSVGQSYRDSLVTRITARGGFWLTPALYAFSEVGGNLREFSETGYTSRGYRVVGGIGTDRISLFRGEIFAGIQRQVYDQPMIADAVSPILGGKIYWYPTRALTFSAALDQTFSDSSVPTPGNPNGNPARISTARLNVNYQLAQDWSAGWRIGFDHSAYLGSTRRDNGWWTGASLSYDIYRNVALTMDYDYFRMYSNVSSAQYTRNVVNIGLKYRY